MTANMTPLMLADDIAAAFNATTERQYWRAELAGSRSLPCVHFNSRSSMVRIIYWPNNDTFTVQFSKVSCSFGDFLSSAHRSLEQVLLAMKASGHECSAPVDGSGVFRIEYDPATKDARVHIAKTGDHWHEAPVIAFKVPEQNNSGTVNLGLDLPDLAATTVSVESDNN